MNQRQYDFRQNCSNHIGLKNIYVYWESTTISSDGIYFTNSLDYTYKVDEYSLVHTLKSWVKNIGKRAVEYPYKSMSTLEMFLSRKYKL